MTRRRLKANHIEPGAGAQAPVPSPQFPIVLNDRWRLTHDGKLQWILQQRVGKKASRRPDGSFWEPWCNRYYWHTREGLLFIADEHCGEFDRSLLEALPEGYPRPDKR